MIYLLLLQPVDERGIPALGLWRWPNTHTWHLTDEIGSSLEVTYTHSLSEVDTIWHMGPLENRSEQPEGVGSRLCSIKRTVYLLVPVRGCHCLVWMILWTGGYWNPLFRMSGTVPDQERVLFSQGTFSIGAGWWKQCAFRPFWALPVYQMSQQHTMLNLNFRPYTMTVHDGFSRLAGSAWKYLFIKLLDFFS